MHGGQGRFADVNCPRDDLMFLVHRRDFLRGWKLFADRNPVPLPLAGIVKKFEGFLDVYYACVSQGHSLLKYLRYGLLHCASLLGARSPS